MLLSEWRRAYTRNVRLYYPYRQYTNLFIFRFVRESIPICLSGLRFPFRDHTPNDDMDWLYFRIFYISDSVDRKIKTMFKNGLSVRTTHKSMTLRQALKPGKTRWLQPNKLRDFQQPPLRALLEMWYEITCNRCHESYIGSTIRHTHDRVKEHVTKPSPLVYKCLASHGSSESEITVKILIRDNDPVNLRLKEALYIRRKKPKINSKDECNELVDLLF